MAKIMATSNPIRHLLILLVFNWIVVCIKSKSVPTVNFVALYEDENEKAVKWEENVVKYLHKEHKDEVKVGKVYTMYCKNMSTICKNSQFQDFLNENERPDFLLDFSTSVECGTNVQNLMKKLRFPTVSVNKIINNIQFDQLSTDEEKYLIQLVSPSDLFVNASLQIFQAKEMGSAYFFFVNSRRGYFYRLSKSFVADESAAADTHIRFETAAAGAAGESRIRNFFLFGSSSAIGELLSDLNVKLNSTFFTDEYTWYSMSLNPEIPHCTKCSKSMRIMNMSPVMANIKNNAHPGITAKSTMTELYYFDAVQNAILVVAELKKSTGKDSWTVPPVQSCSKLNTETSFKLNILKPLETLMNKNTNLLGSYSTEIRIHPIFNATIDYLRFKSGTPDNVTRVGNWSSDGSKRKSYDKNDFNIQNHDVWMEHIAKEPLSAAIIFDEPYTMKSDRDCDQKTLGFNSIACYNGFIPELILKILEDLKKYKILVTSIETEYGSKSNENPKKWSGIVGAILEKKVDMGLVAMGITKEREAEIDLIPFMRNKQTNETYGLALPKNSPLLKPFKHMIHKLVNQRFIRQLMEIWFVEYKGNFTMNHD